MDVQPIGDDKLVIYLDSDEVKNLPAPPCEITTDEASDILRLALGSTYDQGWESVYFELFPGRDSLLLFALQHSGNPYYYVFPGIEPLIAAAAACPSGLISYLTYIGDTYILIVYPWNGEYPPQVLYEYGEELTRPAHYALHLSEHSTVIAGPTALDELHAAFK
ncbi:hypothetical protein SAMN02745823_03634 [Sporobacter termitidis DSM 10068]|uniref:Uncharacterized protein n=1 Tax=Sporobacter termitidis DSM 10068 TaxID=1123282 RepID=A0A1M5ZET6_9FIRM|nr:hypothetical protein [Sporobacter termitidis]SHI22727.1 hypothetical protein SAMN02745823_03634 [Sporobacter termitidis DSM 10068]